MIKERLVLPELINGPRGNFLRVLAPAVTQLLVGTEADAALNTASALSLRLDQIPGGSITPCFCHIAFGSWAENTVALCGGRLAPNIGRPGAVRALPTSAKGRRSHPHADRPANGSSRCKICGPRLHPSGRPALRKPVRKRSRSSARANGRLRRSSPTVKAGMRRSSSSSVDRPASTLPSCPSAAARIA
jgi:hypothetical protein